MSAVETNAWRRVAFKDISTNTRIITTPDFADYNNLHVVMLLKRGGTQIANDIYFDGVNSGSKYCRLRRTNNTVSQGASENTVDVRGDEENDRYITFDMENWSGEEKILYGHLMIVGDDVEDQQDIQFGAKYVEKSGQINNISVDARSGNTFGSGSYIAVYASTPNSITDEKTTLTSVPANTRYEETDTRKIYRWKQAPLEPVFHYKFSESSGDVINHGSVASADLTVTSLTRDQSTPSGLGNGMKTPDEDSGYAENTSRVNDYKFMHDGTAKWSITFWLKCYGVPDTSTTEHMLFGNVWTDDAGIGFGIRLAKNSDNSSSVCRIQTLIADGDSGMPLNDQTPDGMMPDVSNWHFYCITYDPTLSSNNLTVSRDATTSGTGFHQGDYDDVAYSTSNPTRKTTYFARPTSSYDHGIVGTLAQVMIFKDVILSQANKESLYASGNGTTTIPDSKEWVERGTA